MNEKENLHYRLKQLGLEMLGVSQTICDIYGKDFANGIQLNGAAQMVLEWSENVKDDTVSNLDTK